jgi:hypothetical protein
MFTARKRPGLNYVVVSILAVYNKEKVCHTHQACLPCPKVKYSVLVIAACACNPFVFETSLIAPSRFSGLGSENLKPSKDAAEGP